MWWWGDLTLQKYSNWKRKQIKYKPKIIYIPEKVKVFYQFFPLVFSYEDNFRTTRKTLNIERFFNDSLYANLHYTFVCCLWFHAD